MLRHKFLPPLIGLLVVAELSAALIGASRLRADQRRGRAIAAEHREVAAYRKALLPVVFQVYDAVQPLQDLDDAFPDRGPALKLVGQDFLSRSTAVDALASARQRAAALVAPGNLRAPSRDVTYELEDLRAVALALQAAPHGKADDLGLLPAFEAAFGHLEAAEAGWFGAMEGVYGQDLTVPVPSTRRSAGHGRTPATTRAGFVLGADTACQQGLADRLELSPARSPEDVLVAFVSLRAIEGRVGAALAQLALPSADAAAEQRLAPLLKAEQQLPAAFDSLARAFSGPSQSALADALHRFDALLPKIGDLGRALESLGARVCGGYFDVTALLSRAGRGRRSA